jgi:hypothetical protein
MYNISRDESSVKNYRPFRARHAAKGGATPASPGSGGLRPPPGAFLSRYREKSATLKFPSRCIPAQKHVEEAERLISNISRYKPRSKNPSHSHM